MINTKYRWIRRPQPFSVVKPDVNMNINSQSSYITHLKKDNLTAKNDTSCIIQTSQPTISHTFKKKSYLSFNAVANSACMTTKKIGSSSQGDYLIHLDNKCNMHDAVQLPKTSFGLPII